jgi:hypothetical protein
MALTSKLSLKVRSLERPTSMMAVTEPLVGSIAFQVLMNNCLPLRDSQC